MIEEETEMETAVSEAPAPNPNEIIIRFVDECLAELGTQGLIDGDKARNQLLDIRHFLSQPVKEEPGDIDA